MNSLFMEVIMCSYKIFYPIVTTVLLISANVAHAGVYDFGRVQMASNSYTAPDSFASASMTKSSANDNGLHNIDYWTQFGEDKHPKFSEMDKLKLAGSHSGEYTPIISPVTEPETYAMILAGLCLIGFTARRRDRIG